MGYKSRFEDIQLLIRSFNSQHKNINELIIASLFDKAISDDLRIAVKHFLGDAQSILDYCAHDIADHYGIVRRIIYFPIVDKVDGFKGSIGRNLPGLGSKTPNLLDYLESIQPYHEGCSWLGDFVSLNKEHKHVRLVPQCRIEIPVLEMKHKGASIKLIGKGLSLSIPLNDSISLAEAPIFERQKIVVDSQLDQIGCDKRIDIKKQIWVDIKFDGTDLSVLGLIEKIKDNLSGIIENIYKFLR